MAAGNSSFIADANPKSAEEVEDYHVSKKKYRCVGRVKESHTNPIYGLVFNTLDPRYDNIFASCAGRRVTVYECHESGRMSVLQVFEDEDSSEEFFTCVFSRKADGTPLIAVGGHRGAIKIVNCKEQSLEKCLVGHGAPVMDLKVHPFDPNLLLSCSEDLSIRLWNIANAKLVIVFAGDEGHREGVLSCCFNMSGTKVASCGHDHAIKIWSLETPEIKEEIAKSGDSNVSYEPIYVQFPDFTTKRVHRNYVDCIAFVGDELLLTKTVHPEESKGKKKEEPVTAMLWRPVDDKSMGPHIRQNGHIVGYNEFRISDPLLWYVRFAVDADAKIMALGNKEGKVNIYAIDPAKPNLVLQRLIHKQCTKTVRNIAIGPNRRVILISCDDSTIWRWDYLAK